MPKDSQTEEKKKADAPIEPRAEQVHPGEKKYILVELSCDFRHCDPCTYPNCQRFMRETKKKKPFTTKIFEVDRAHWEKTTTEKK